MGNKSLAQTIFCTVLAAGILFSTTSVLSQGAARPGAGPEVEGAQKAMSVKCVGRFQTGTTWNTPGTIVRSYTLANVSGINKEAKCTTNNIQYALPLTKSQTVANEACAAGALDNDHVRAISKAGLLASGGTDHLIGILDRGAAVYNCPQGGSLNGSNCVQTVAATCPAGYSLSGGNCVKTYAANMVTPAFCKFLP
ncbi:MAG: hypothetical protein V4772_11560 [Pseudomonadota bacterium]